MILPCPNCKARFLVDPVAIGPSGRQVRCGRCRESWFQPGVAVDEAAPAAEAVPEFVIRPRTPGANLPALRPKPRSRAAAWFVLFGLIAVAASLAYVATQGDIAATWRSITSAISGPPTDAPPPGASPLALTPENIQTVQDGKSLVVSGVIVNRSDQVRDVPKLKLIFLNADKSRELASKSFSANAARADPRSAVKFEVRVDEIPTDAVHIRVVLEN